MNSMMTYRWLIPYLAKQPKHNRMYWLWVRTWLIEELFKQYEYTSTPWNEGLFKQIISDIDEYGYY